MKLINVKISFLKIRRDQSKSESVVEEKECPTKSAETFLKRFNEGLEPVQRMYMLLQQTI